MDIGVPRIVGKALLLLNDTALLEPAAPLLDRASIASAREMTGCNAVWVASANILRAAFDGNTTRMQEAYDVIHSTMVVSPEWKPGCGERQV